jgi:hypothetical protein
MDMSNPAKEGMDMNHSKMERMDDIKQSKWDMSKICKGRNGNGSF